MISSAEGSRVANGAMTSLSRLVTLSKVSLLSGVVAILLSSIAVMAKPTTQIVDHEYNLPAVMALQLARSGNLIPEADMPEVIRSLSERGTVPRRFQDTFERLLPAAQMLIEIRAARHFFPVGFEFETGHHTHDSIERFRLGAQSIAQAIDETFGLSRKARFTEITKEGDPMEVAEVLDQNRAKWLIVQEYVRDDARSTTPTGWETVSPPIFNPDHLPNIAAFMIRLGQNAYGREAEFTGAHQTFDILPRGISYDSRLMALTVANYMLIKQQFAPQIFDLLRVERFGGYRNFFIRPLILDHQSLLAEISSLNPSELTMEKLNQIMNEKYAVAEFDAHVRNTPIYSERDRNEMLAWTERSKQRFKKLWKYHDLRIHFKPDNPARTLVEDRTGDYREGSPQDMLRVTFFTQNLLRTAFEMAQAGRLFSFSAPQRRSAESDAAYWERLARDPNLSQDRLLDIMRLDPTQRSLLKGEEFTPRGPRFSALPRPSFGFEKEFIGHEVVDLIVPKDPEARAKWADLSQNQRIRYFASLLADDEERERFLNEERIRYSPDTRRVVQIEFEVDTFRFPFLDRHIFIEDSGNFEIKSNGRDLFSIEALFEMMGQTNRVLNKTNYGAHVHLFVPNSMLQSFRARPELADRFGSFLERISTLMQLEDYRAADEPGHYLDSWSLDRLSERDIRMVTDWLKGKGPLGNLAQKYHNIGVREVDGGLDLELRSVGDDLDYAKRLLGWVEKAILRHDFGVDHEFGRTSPLFHDFSQARRASEAQRFTLYDAVGKRYALTQTQKEILFKLQFEIYKPSMAEYIHFDEFETHHAVDPKKMDVRFIRSNFESNVALPLLNWEEQPYLQQSQLGQIGRARQAFIEKVYSLVRQIETDQRYVFLRQERDFLHLADWLERSEHPSRPDFARRTPPPLEARRQRAALESLVKRLRTYSIRFVKDTQINEMLEVTFDSARAQSLIRPMEQTQLAVRTPRPQVEVTPASRAGAICFGLVAGGR
jgi:hypothetical protein